MNFFRFFVVVLLAKALAIALYVIVTFISVLSVGKDIDTQRADAIVVMGAAQYDGRPSPQLASRLNHAFYLWKNKQAPLIAVTGGKQRADRFTEAETSQRFLENLGVPAAQIIFEDQGHSTYESLRNLIPALQKGDISSVVVVSDAYHLQRSMLTLRELGIKAQGSATRTSPIQGWQAFERTIKETIGISVGRLMSFEQLWSITG